MLPHDCVASVHEASPWSILTHPSSILADATCLPRFDRVVFSEVATFFQVLPRRLSICFYFFNVHPNLEMLIDMVFRALSGSSSPSWRPSCSSVHLSSFSWVSVIFLLLSIHIREFVLIRLIFFSLSFLLHRREWWRRCLCPPVWRDQRIWYEKACTFYFHLYKWRDQRMIRERLHLLFDLVQILTDYVNSLLRMLDVTVVRSWDGRIWRHNWSITMRSTDILTICREAFVVHLTLFHSFGFSHFLLISVDVVSFFWLLGFPIFY